MKHAVSMKEQEIVKNRDHFQKRRDVFASHLADEISTVVFGMRKLPGMQIWKHWDQLFHFQSPGNFPICSVNCIYN